MNVFVRNIPPFWNALSHWLACMLYVRLLPRRFGTWQSCTAAAALFPLFWLAQKGLSTLTGLPFNLIMCVFVGITLLPFLLLSHTPPRNAVYYCARAFILGGFMVSLMWQLYMFSIFMRYLPDAWYTEALFALCIFGCTLAVMYLLERRHRKEISEMRLPAASVATTALVAFLFYVLSSLSFTSIITPFGSNDDLQSFNIRTIVYLAGVAILYSTHQQLCDVHVRREVSALQNMLNMQYANYCASQESIDLINRKYHDLKHQIAALRTEMGSEQKMAYLDRMEAEIHAYEAQNKTGNRVLDTILTSKSLHCQEQGIQLTCVADGAALDFMDVVDLSTLFGNALDNAIEGVNALPNAEQRLIHLTISREKGFICIRVENPCAPDLRLDAKQLKTTKRDAANHGYGLKSIRLTAEKYGGSASVHAADGWFELRVLLPRSEKQ